MLDTNPTLLLLCMSYSWSKILLDYDKTGTKPLSFREGCRGGLIKWSAKGLVIIFSPIETKFSPISNGPYYMDHIIWTISYGP